MFQTLVVMSAEVHRRKHQYWERIHCVVNVWLIDCWIGMSSIQRLLFLITYLIRFAIRQWKLKVWRSNAEDPIGSYQVTLEKSQIVYRLLQQRDRKKEKKSMGAGSGEHGGWSRDYGWMEMKHASSFSTGVFYRKGSLVRDGSLLPRADRYEASAHRRINICVSNN